MRTRLEQVLAGQTAAVIAEFAAWPPSRGWPTAKRAALSARAGYYRRNLPYMRYDEYLARGLADRHRGGGRGVRASGQGPDGAGGDALDAGGGAKRCSTCGRCG